ncbi:unnamed protein product [Durusdinium trenchii]|uniref:Uncharacterized protein n=1 Tax=Durusdinium trenchii TaxID=1381693 RepID=A0ABP0P5S0_9DINO
MRFFARAVEERSPRVRLCCCFGRCAWRRCFRWCAVCSLEPTGNARHIGID